MKIYALTVLLIICQIGFAQNTKHTFALGDSTFLLDGKPFQMISGELHYPRIPREAWRHRMQMAKAMGLNTIGTYVFWNVHEPEKGVYDFEGNNDIAAFVRTAQEEGLWVVLRPSPYVCAEWEFGGYPYWLQKEEGLVVRSLEPKFLQAYKNYLMRVAKELAPLQVHHGGNVLLVQVENEYGFYSNDRAYMEMNRKLFIEAGFDGLLYTCDPAPKVKDGHLPGLLPAVNGLSQPEKIKKLVTMYNDGKGPYYVAEWYPAWFDWWGTPHHTVPASAYVPKLDSLLAAGISVNMYMFHGGTTRGFMNGANDNDSAPFEPQISSYDYDAPLDEAGNPTAKFFDFRKVIQKYVRTELPPVPPAKPSVKLQNIKLQSSISIADILPKGINNHKPLTFEDINQAYGYMLYRTVISDAKSGILKINELRDYALIFVNGKRVGVLDRRLNQDSLFLDLKGQPVTLDIFVENMGRVNFGPYLLKNEKGITNQVTLNNIELTNWTMYGFPFDDTEKIEFRKSKIKNDYPVLKKGNFKLDACKDTYLNMSVWGKGVVWVNGHNLGKYWSIGPQQTLYVPAEWLRVGENEVVVLELLKVETSQNELQSTAMPELNRLQIQEQ